jgi:hypothetical protein
VKTVLDILNNLFTYLTPIAGAAIAILAFLVTQLQSHPGHTDAERNERLKRQKKLAWGILGAALISIAGSIRSASRLSETQKALVQKQDELSQRQKELITAQNQTLAWMTGGETFVRLEPTLWYGSPDIVSFQMMNLGKFPVYDILVNCMDVDLRVANVKAHKLSAPDTAVWKDSILFPSTVYPTSPTSEMTFNINS